MPHTPLLPTRHVFRRELVIALLIKMLALIVLKLVFFPSRVPAEAVVQGLTKHFVHSEALVAGSRPSPMDMASQKENK